MADLIQADQFKSLLQKKTPLLDVRAPVEYQKGSLPGSCNVPLLNNGQRQEVGTCYRERGRQAAIALGEKLLTHEARCRRIQSWTTVIRHHPDTVLYCSRGGLRSEIAQQWLHDANLRVPRIAGGYKALRHFLIAQVEQLSRGDNLILIAGKTGSGKTHLLCKLPNHLDLEGIACHRGSAFGRRIVPQPNQADFENRLAVRLLELDWKQQRRVVVEDESRAIGSLSIPLPLYRRMNQSSLALLEVSLEQRVNTIHQDYIQTNYTDFKNRYPEQAEQLFADSLLQALARIRRRLGEELFSRLSRSMQDALRQQQQTGKADDHRDWIRELLIGYYDPMYEYQLNGKSRYVAFSGSAAEIADWIQPQVTARQSVLSAS